MMPTATVEKVKTEEKAHPATIRERLHALISDTKTAIGDQIQSLLDRDPYRERVKLTIADAFRLGRKMKPKHLKGALFSKVFDPEEATQPKVGTACHLGALAVGWGAWDDPDIGSSRFWPSGVPDPVVAYPCDCAYAEGFQDTMTNVIIHMADHHGVDGRYTNEFMANWLDKNAPQGEFETDWTVADMVNGGPQGLKLDLD